MKTRVFGFALLMACLLGCVPSLHELYTDDTLVYDPALVGTWQEDRESPELWRFNGDPNSKSYDILITEEKDGKLKESKLVGHIVELDGKRYLDIIPQKDVKLNVGDWFTFGLIRAHLFLKMDIKGDTLMLAIMKPDSVEELIEKDPTLIKHEKTEDRIILTASPKELQAFIKKYAVTKDFFDKMGELKRKPQAPAAN